MAGAATVMLLGGVAACSSSAGSAAPAKAGTCLAALGDGAATAPLPTGSPGPSLPKHALDCLDGSGDVTLAAIDRPTIITLWAGWCPPCRAELPSVEAFAQASADQVDVIGIDTADTRADGQSMVTDLGLSFPMLFDPDKLVLGGAHRANLPVTLFVMPGGQIQAVYDAAGLDGATLRQWSEKYLGVQS
jgi:thiol-disulfide isomerase/thioredoxin